MTDQNENKAAEITAEDVQIDLQGKGITKELQQKIMTNVEDALPDMQVLLLTQKIQQLKDANQFIKDQKKTLDYNNETINKQQIKIEKLEDREENVKKREENLKWSEDQLKKNQDIHSKDLMEFEFEKKHNDLHLKLAGDKASIYQTCFEQIVKVPTVRTMIQKDVVVKTAIMESQCDDKGDYKQVQVGEEENVRTLTETKTEENDNPKAD